MRRLMSYTIGMLVLFSSLSAVPELALAGEDVSVSHCELCSDEDKASGICDPIDATSESGIMQSSPFGKNCDCDFNQANDTKKAGVLFSGTQLSSGKMFANIAHKKAEHQVVKNKFTTANLINAPPTSYIKSLGSIQQLK